MFAFLVSLLILDAILLSVVVLLQAGQGGGLAGLGGATTDTVLGGRQAVTILTKLSWWCGGIFMVLSLLLSFTPRGGNSSGLQERLRQGSPAAAAPQAPLPLGAPAQSAPNQKSPLPLGTPTQPAAGAPKAAPQTAKPPSAQTGKSPAAAQPTPPKK
jgi:preprotein translocase subunit SecG